jgi:hypothetical protein
MEILIYKNVKSTKRESKKKMTGFKHVIYIKVKINIIVIHRDYNFEQNQNEYKTRLRQLWKIIGTILYIFFFLYLYSRIFATTSYD